MKSALKQALADCLARLEAGAGIEECLRGHEALAAELRPLLEAAQALRARDVADYRPDAFQRGRARMHAARMSETERGGRPAWAGLWRPLALTGVAAAVAVLAALGLTTGVLRFGADTTSAQVDGVVSRVDPDAIILITADGRVSIRIAENTVVLDANGNPISGGEIAPGRSARIEVEEENGEYSAQRIEVEDEDDEGRGAEVEFSGNILAVSGSTLTVETSFGTATVVIGPNTEVKGTLTAGVAVKVHANVQADGSYLAREIEAAGDGGEDGTGDGGGGGGGTPSSGPGGDDSSGGGTPSSGSGDDDKPEEEGD
jgi:uncharacterized membrane protein YgcG